MVSHRHPTDITDMQQHGFPPICMTRMRNPPRHQFQASVIRK